MQRCVIVVVSQPCGLAITPPRSERAPPAQVRLLHHVLGVAHRTEHPISDRRWRRGAGGARSAAPGLAAQFHASLAAPFPQRRAYPWRVLSSPPGARSGTAFSAVTRRGAPSRTLGTAGDQPVAALNARLETRWLRPRSSARGPASARQTNAGNVRAERRPTAWLSAAVSAARVSGSSSTTSYNLAGARSRVATIARAASSIHSDEA